jgi:hypothetical protein
MDTASRRPRAGEPERSARRGTLKIGARPGQTLKSQSRNWENSKWTVQFTTSNFEFKISRVGPDFLHHPVVAPRPSTAEVELLLSAGSGIGVVQLGGREDHTEFAKQFVKDRIAVGEARELDTIAVHIADRRLFTGDDEFSKVAQCCRVGAKELDQGVRVLQGT